MSMIQQPSGFASLNQNMSAIPIASYSCWRSPLWRNKGLPPEVHLVAIEKGEPIEDDPLALLWRNICSQQRRIDNFQVHTRRDLEILTRLIGEQRRQLKIYSEKSVIELRELLHIVESRIQELKEEKADLEALNRRSRESGYLI